MDKKSIIAIVGALILGIAGFVLKEDVKSLVCQAPAAAEVAK